MTLIVLSLLACIPCNAEPESKRTLEQITQSELNYYNELNEGTIPKLDSMMDAYTNAALRLSKASKKHGIMIGNAEIWYCTAIIMGMEPNRKIVNQVVANQKMLENPTAGGMIVEPKCNICGGSGWIACSCSGADPRCPICGGNEVYRCSCNPRIR
jgi:hypothetical protein